MPFWGLIEDETTKEREAFWGSYKNQSRRVAVLRKAAPLILAAVLVTIATSVTAQQARAAGNCRDQVEWHYTSDDYSSGYGINHSSEPCIIALGIYDTNDFASLNVPGAYQNLLGYDYQQVGPGQTSRTLTVNYDPACKIQADPTASPVGTNLSLVYPSVLTGANQGPQSEVLIWQYAFTRGYEDCGAAPTPTIPPPTATEKPPTVTPTATKTPTPTLTAKPSVTPKASVTPTKTATASATTSGTPSPTVTGVPPGETPQPSTSTATKQPPTATPTKSAVVARPTPLPPDAGGGQLAIGLSPNALITLIVVIAAVVLGSVWFGSRINSRP